MLYENYYASTILTKKKQIMNEIINNHKDLFWLPDEPLSHTDVTAHKIAIIDNRPINTKQYRFPPVHKDEINKQVKDLLENELSNHRIHRITRPYRSYLKYLIQRIIKGGEW